MNKIAVCPAVIAGIVDYANKVVRKTQYRELNMKVTNLNTFQTQTNV